MFRSSSSIIYRSLIASSSNTWLSQMSRPSHLSLPSTFIPSNPSLLSRHFSASSYPAFSSTPLPSFSSSLSSPSDQNTKTDIELARQALPFFLRWTISSASVRIAKATSLYRACEKQANSPDFLRLLGPGYAHIAVAPLEGDQPLDTFHRWFSRTLLHVWLVLVRLRFSPADQKRDADLLAQEVFNKLWTDMEIRITDELGHTPGKAFVLGKQMKAYSQFYYGSVVAYDEALLGSDALLAEALWRNIFHLDTQHTSPSDLYALTFYLRRQLSSFADKKLDLLANANLSFEPVALTSATTKSAKR